MNILLMNGSPRKKGNTQSILELYGEVLQKQIGIEQSKLIYVSLADQSIELCRGCRVCMENSEAFCPCKDNVRNIEAQMVMADIIIIGTPVYVEDVSGLMKLWIDRMAFRCHRPFLNGKMVYLVTTSGANASNHAIKTLKQAFLSWGAKVIGGNNYSMGPRMETINVKNKYEELIKKQINRIQKNKKKIPIYSLIGFEVQKKYWIKKGLETDSYDYQYWKSKGWLEKSCSYYYPVRVDHIKHIMVKGIGIFVGKILY